jgi:hypothetical protein
MGDLRDDGLLWLLNTAVLHPRGFALAFHYDDDDTECRNPTGWLILGDGTEPWVMRDGPENDRCFAAVEALLEEHRRGEEEA